MSNNNCTYLEAIEYITSKDKIENMPINIYEKIINLNPNEQYGNYILKNVMKNRGIVFREIKERENGSKETKLHRLECVIKYYDINDCDITCNEIMKQINNISNNEDLEYYNCNCLDCHRKCLELYKIGTLSKI